MTYTTDLLHQRFGDWYVVGRAPNASYGGARWLCRCKCGNTRTIDSHDLRHGKTKSCRNTLQNGSKS